MNEKELKCIEHLEIGIQYKREENFREAISQYELAYSEDPLNTNVYSNMAKVFGKDCEI